MLNKPKIEQLAGQIIDAIPDLLIPTATSARQNLIGIMRSVVANLDLVSRDDFDAQVAVLQHTRARLEALERQVSQLEQLLNRSDSQ
jgi:ubiquinone biosynthesis accessory factor UbiK